MHCQLCPTKDFVIAVLVAYVVTDILCSLMGAHKHRSVLERVWDGNSSMLTCLALGIIAGIIAWYIARNQSQVIHTLESEL